MKKLFGSTWVLSVLALILGLGTQAGVIAWRLNSSHVEEEHAAGPKPPETLVWTFLSPEIENLKQELRSRVEALASRERELQDYEVRLRAERAEIEKLKRDIESRRAELSASITEVQALEQKNLKNLAATYSNLTPAAALAIFEQMDDEMVVKILAFMKPDPVGQILEEMARTKEGEGTLAGRAAVISNKLRLLRQVRAEEKT